MASLMQKKSGRYSTTMKVGYEVVSDRYQEYSKQVTDAYE